MGKDIAILTMSLNIGGAETHIFELACALHARGHRVTVFSAGGVYADKLRECGVTHVEAPLNKKDPASLIKSYHIVARYVRSHPYCVIHSHTRISNFTARAVSRRYKVPFVSTVHFNFATGLFFRLVTSWGDRALAVSEDLKNYAAEEYGFDRDKITVTVNGINLNTFRKNRLADFRAENGAAAGDKVILCVSRLDQVAGDHVERVINMAEKIYSDTPESRIIIVGGGTRFEEFKERAEAINAKTKDGFIRLVGPQTDIYRFCNIADLFIGISRSALEAMACEVPVILLGNSGYLGMYSEKTHDACIDTNFTCRGCPYPEESEITGLVKDILAEPSKYDGAVADALNIVKTRYSIDRMAKDAEDAYSAARNDLRPNDIILCGYYGRHNLGDDMSLKAFADNMVNVCGVSGITLLSADPKNAGCDHVNKVIHRFDLPRIYKSMKRTKLFVLGGGSILQDATSSRSMYYYTHIEKKKKKLGCRVMLYGNGVGPIIKDKNRKRAVRLLSEADMITVRDRRSLVYMRSIGVENPRIVMTADETFTMDRDAIVERYDGLKDGNYVCINLRSSEIVDKYFDSIARIIDRIADLYKLTPVLLPIHFHEDVGVLKELAGKLKCEHIIIDELLTHGQQLDVLRKCRVSITERLHAIIFSCIYGKPFIAINYDPKVLSFCEEMGMERYVLGVSGFSEDKALDRFADIMENEDGIREYLEKTTAQKRELALGNAIEARKLLYEVD